MSVKVADIKVALFRDSLPEALREAAEWVEHSEMPIWNINVESDDDGSYIVLVYFHSSESGQNHIN